MDALLTTRPHRSRGPLSFPALLFLALFALPAAPLAAQQMNHGAMGDSTGWRMPPGGPNMAMMMALFRGFLPDVAPFLPAPMRAVESLPEALGPEVLELADGDTLRLEAMVLKRELDGRLIKVYGFNGQSPGPTLRVAQNASITVEFTNHIDFATTLRWHGVRVDNQYDGVPGQTQSPVQVGDSYTAEIRFPDAGVYWYHPHQRAHIAQDLGLYGSILVESPDPDYYGPANHEEVLILDDVLLDDRGSLPWGFEAPTHALMGRFGNLLLVNGEPGFRRTVKRGDVVRMFITNASNTRPFNLSLESGPMKLVAGDMSRFEREVWVNNAVIAPGQRYVLEARFGEEGEFALTNRITTVDHMLGTFVHEVDTLGIFTVSSDRTDEDHGDAFQILRSNPEVAAEFEALRAHLDRAPDKELHLSLRINSLPVPIMRMLEADTLYYPPLEFNDPMPMMNWLTTGLGVTWVIHEPDPEAERGDLGPASGWRFTQGDMVKIRVFNSPDSRHPMSHPMHLHGQRFVVLAQDGVPMDNLVWRDTVLIPLASTVDLLVEMANPGNWMFNCQIPEHLGSGMSMSFSVEPAGAQ